MNLGSSVENIVSHTNCSCYNICCFYGTILLLLSLHRISGVVLATLQYRYTTTIHKIARVVFGPDLVMLDPHETFNVLFLSGKLFQEEPVGGVTGRSQWEGLMRGVMGRGL